MKRRKRLSRKKDSKRSRRRRHEKPEKIVNPKSIKELITAGKQKGYLTYDEVNNILPHGEVSADQVDEMLAILGRENIEVVDTQELVRKQQESELVVEEKQEEKEAVQLQHEEIESLAKAVQLDDPVKMYLEDVYTTSVNLAGLPGLSLPCGLSKDGLPVGMQLVGPAYSEALLLKVGRGFEIQNDFYRLVPDRPEESRRMENNLTERHPPGSSYV